MNVTFLVYRLDRTRLMSTEFYRQDIEILESLGHRVTVATSLREVPRETDLIFLWWWNWLWLVGPYLKMRGLPICVTGSLEPDLYEKRSWLYRLLVRSGMRFADKSVFVSQYMIDRLMSLVPMKDPLLCPHIVLDEYRPLTPENKRGLPRTILNVAWKGKRNTQRKMLPQLVDAFALVLREAPDVRLILAGEPLEGGPLLERQARLLGIETSIEFRGKIAKEEKISLMQHCGAYYQCSQHEGFGLAIAEAMACGAPLVVNRKTAIPEVVGDCGYYVRNESVESIAATLLHALNHPEESRTLGQRAARRIDEHFRFARRRDFFENLLSEMPLKKQNSTGAAETARRAA